MWFLWRYWGLCAGIRDLHINIQEADLVKTPADEVKFLSKYLHSLLVAWGALFARSYSSLLSLFLFLFRVCVCVLGGRNWPEISYLN